MKKRLLKEQEAVIPVREITNDEKSRLETFQEVLGIIHDYFSIQRPSLEQYQNFRDRIEPYFDQPYMYKVERMINNIDSELESVEEAIPKREENIKQLESQVKDIEDDFFNGNIESAHEKAQKTKEPIVQVLDKDGNMIVPSKVYNKGLHDVFKIFVEFDTPISGFALVSDSKKSYRTYDGYNFLSSIEKEVITQFYDNNREMYFPSEQRNMDDGIEIEDGEYGYLYVDNSDLVWEQDVESKVWNIEHNFLSTGVFVQIYDENWNRIMPSSITLQNLNTCSVTFDTATKGKAILKEIGSLNIKDDIINKLKNEGAVMKLGDGKDVLYSDYKIQNEVKSIDIPPENIYTDTDNNLFIETKLDESDKFNITECAIYDVNGIEIYFYSQGNNIHKYEKFTMTLFYRINYKNLYINGEL